MTFDDPIDPKLADHEIGFALRQAAEKAVEAGDEALAAQYDVASRVAWLVPKLDSPTQPYGPRVISHLGDSGALPEFTDDDIANLEVVYGLTANDALRARIADVLWLIGPPAKRVGYAGEAIESYSKHPIDVDAWYTGGSASIRRALQLARRLGTPLLDTHKKLAEMLETLILAASTNDKFKPISMASVLWEEARGQVAADHIAGVLARLSADHETAGDLHLARGFASAAAEWYAFAGDAEARLDQIDRLADLWTAEAKARPGLAAATFLQDALQTLRQIPRESREARGTEARIADTIRLMQEANQDALNEMHAFPAEPIDIREGVEAAENMVRGKPLLDALLQLSIAMPLTNIVEARERAIKSIQEHPLQSLFQTSRIAPDGRVVHKTPGSNADDGEANIHREMMREHSFRVSLVTQSLIVPALIQIRSEHQPSLLDFEALCHDSGFVPLDRFRLFAKGLFYGFELDLGASIHMLAPQLENAIRQHLKVAGVQTTHVDRDSIEMEIGLSNLMERPQVEELFGADLAFEIKATFTDQLGANLRNDVAHGLIADNVAGSMQVIYAWWLCLRIVTIGFWNRLLAAKKEADEATEDDAQAAAE